jgi:hypothetical protein
MTNLCSTTLFLKSDVLFLYGSGFDQDSDFILGERRGADTVYWCSKYRWVVQKYRRSGGTLLKHSDISYERYELQSLTFYEEKRPSVYDTRAGPSLVLTVQTYRTSDHLEWPFFGIPYKYNILIAEYL